MDRPITKARQLRRPELLPAFALDIGVPTPPIQVVPSLRKEVQIIAESICTYEYGTKVDVKVIHLGRTKFDDFRLTVGPTELVRAGVSEQRRPFFSNGDVFKFTTVVAADALELTLDAATAGEQVGPVFLQVDVPVVRDASNTPPFRFLEPKKLTQADVRVRTLDEASELILSHSGVYDVYGGGTKYRVEIKPAHPNVEAVQLRGISGSVEVTDIPSDAGIWAFQMVVVANGVLTSTTTLHFDVTTPDGLQHGELNLAVRPSNTKLWLVAATAGAAVTVKGVAAAVPALLNPGDLWHSLAQAVTRVESLGDVVQFLSIPITRVGLWILDKLLAPLQDG